MLNLFKSSHPAILFFLLLYAISLKIIYFIQPLPFNFATHAPLSNLLYRILFAVFSNNPYWENVLATLLVMFQAILFNQFLNNYKIIPGITFLPAMAYILITSLFWEFATLSPALVANTFMIFVVKKLFSTYKKEKSPVELFDIGFLTGIASLFYFPVVFILHLIFIALLILRPFSLREWLTVIIGLVVPYFLLGTYYFWKDSLPFFLHNHFVKPFEEYACRVDFHLNLLIEGGLIIICLLWSSVMIQSYLYKSVVQWRKFIVIFRWFIVVGFLSFVLQPHLDISHFVVVAIPLSVFIAFLFSEIKKNWLSEAIHLILLLTIIYFQYSYLFF